ncbi:MAG: methyltransferase domain-containing protein [Dehalococcoidia bacterium]|nr:methyltransferase domain-containing protein [Dehalococcoidia bacterium]
MGTTRGHRGFARFWAWMTAHEGEQQHAARRRVVSQLRGRVLEIGFGLGTNWEYLPEDVEYTGIEPDPYMLERARAHAATLGRPMQLVDARAESLPFPDASFDAVFTTLTFCTVEDVPAALAEVRRVLRPGGELHFWEHVRPGGRVTGTLTDAIAPAWRRLGGGCNPNRRTAVAFQRGGFEYTEFKRVTAPPMPMIFGRARVAGDTAGRADILDREVAAEA